MRLKVLESASGFAAGKADVSLCRLLQVTLRGSMARAPRVLTGSLWVSRVGRYLLVRIFLSKQLAKERTENIDRPIWKMHSQ